jgi:ABC-type sugar transport system substrate-binding protein
MTKRKLVASFITRDQEFQLLQAEDAKRAAKEAGYEMEVVFADGRAITQIKQLFSFITLPEEERPAAILVEPASDDVYERVANNAVRAGIGWVLLNSQADYLEDLRKSHPELPVSAVMIDQLEVGHIQAQQYQALLPHGGEMLFVKQGPFPNPAAAERLEGMQERMAGSSIRIHTIQSDWTEVGSERAVEGWFRLKGSRNLGLNLVGCQNDSQAVGAHRALLRNRPEWATLPYTGCDGLPLGGQQLVREGRLKATVVTPSTSGPAVRMVTKSLSTHTETPRIQRLKPRSFPEVSALQA